ncbi:hypothetical protein BG000_010093 [Podila horticola]|nr:hypothetical protein BG000_010093 [Podila horticola]
MSKRQEERHARILTSLLKLAENKKCFDCPSKVNVYVNLFNSTFICEKCSGLHREFNHRVKSISASTFTSEEVASLQKGGNAVAKKIWLATWSWREYPEPDAHEVDELKQFMRAKYVKKLWYQDPNGGAPGGQVETQPNTINHNHIGASTPSTPSTPLTPTAPTPGVRAHNQSIDSLTMAPERNLSRKSSTISSDSGSTTMSKVTDPSSNSINTQRQTPGSTHHHQTSSPRLQQPQQLQQLQQQASFDNFMGLMNNPGNADYGTGSSLGPAFAVTPPSGADPFSLMTNAFSTMHVNSSQITSPDQQARPQLSQTSSMSSNDFFSAFSTPAVSTPVHSTAGATPDPFSLMSQNVPQQYPGQLTPQGQSNYGLEPLSTTPVGSKSFDDYLSMLGQGNQQQQQHQDAFLTMSQGSYNTPPPSLASSNYNATSTPVSLSPQPTTGVANPFGHPTGSSPFPGGLQRAFTSDYPLSSPFGGNNNGVPAPSVGNSNSNPFATFAKQQPIPSNIQHQNAAINNSYLSDPFGTNTRSPQPVAGGQDYFSGPSMSSNAFGSQSLKSPNPFAMGGSGSGFDSAFDQPQTSQHLQLQQPAFVRSMSDSNFGLQTSNQSPFGLPASPSPNSAGYQYSNGGNSTINGSYAFSSPSRSMTLPAPSASGPSHNNNNTAMNEMFGQWMQPAPKNPTSKYPSIDDLDPFSTSAGGVSSSNNQFSNPFSL